MARSIVLTAMLFCTGLALAQPASAGEEKKVCRTDEASSCGPPDYCRVKPPYHPGQKGVCARRPDVCNMLFQPVCGVDGKTYPNSCHANRVGAPIAHEGACPK